MKLRALGLSAVAAVSIAALSVVSPAKAAFIDGTISLAGNNNIDYASDLVRFIAGSSTVGAATGSFLLAGFGLGDTAVMRNEGVFISYASPDLAGGLVPTNLSCGAGCVFNAFSGPGVLGNVAAFNIVGPYSVTEVPGVLLTVIATGTAFLTGYDDTPGTFIYSSQGPGTPTTVTFSATVIGVPGPIAGAGIPGLLAGIGLLALARRRRKAAIA